LGSIHKTLDLETPKINFRKLDFLEQSLKAKGARCAPFVDIR
jgi:hypothetical protein